MNIVDSSGWIEFFTAGPNAPFFREPLLRTDRLIVPTIVVFEVVKRLLVVTDEETAVDAASHMRSGTSAPLDDVLAADAAALSIETRLPMADSIILATARLYGATLWTQDADFAGMDGVQYVEAG